MVITPHVKILSHICHVYSITLSFPVLYMCGLVASPGALKPSVGDGTESSWPLVHTYLSLLSSLPSLGSYLHLFSGVYVNNNNNNNILPSAPILPSLLGVTKAVQFLNSQLFGGHIRLPAVFLAYL